MEVIVLVAVFAAILPAAYVMAKASTVPASIEARMEKIDRLIRGNKQ